MDRAHFIKQVNHFARSRTPFFFVIDFKMAHPFVCPIDEASSYGFYFNINGVTNQQPELTKQTQTDHIALTRTPVTIDQYEVAFKKALNHLKLGDSYLLNLTMATSLDQQLNLTDIFNRAQARYKLLYTPIDSANSLPSVQTSPFVLYSPESFIKIIDNQIYAFPMKGTIDATIENAAELILADQKELWEHNTIVDLIRNDLAIVSEQVVVNRFRYIERLKTNHKDLLQVSSEIRGDLPKDWRSELGSILLKLLPAGSISGAPKQRTVEIIEAIELKPRGFYTGIHGIFDGDNLDSGVNIRFINQIGSQFFYHSGGGITAMSQLESEYYELLDKIYVPSI